MFLSSLTSSKTILNVSLCKSYFNSFWISKEGSDFNSISSTSPSLSFYFIIILILPIIHLNQISSIIKNKID